MVSNFCGKFWK